MSAARRKVDELASGAGTVSRVRMLTEQLAALDRIVASLAKGAPVIVVADPPMDRVLAVLRCVEGLDDHTARAVLRAALDGCT